MIYLVAMAVLVAGCNTEKKEEASKEAAPATESAQASDAGQAKEPDYITVQHCLIGFQGSLPGKNVTRTKEEAAKLAEEILKRAKDGEDFGALVQEYTDDAYPGIYKMANFDAVPDMAAKIYPRGQMVAAFGDTGFPLPVGGIGMAAYDPQKSPYGWHIIKRIK